MILSQRAILAPTFLRQQSSTTRLCTDRTRARGPAGSNSINQMPKLFRYGKVIFNRQLSPYLRDK